MKWEVGWKLIDDNKVENVIFFMDLFKFSNRDTKLLLIYKAGKNKVEFEELFISATYLKEKLDDASKDDK
jgi:hypothetical protein